MYQEKIVPEARTRHMPGEEGAWLFIFGDMIVFAIFFVTFVYYRAQQVELYDQSQLALNQVFGLVNTLLLLTSSWFLAMAVRAFRSGKAQLSRRLIAVTMLFGTGFVVSKGFEWADKFAHGVTVMTNEFFMFYFMFTGIHLVHVLMGLGVLGYLFAHTGRKGDVAGRIGVLESGAAFWHLVDLLWVVLFALIYLMR